MRPKSDIWGGGGLKQLGVDRRAGFAALWVLLIHIVSVYVCERDKGEVQARCSSVAGVPALRLALKPMCCQSWIIQHPRSTFSPPCFLLFFLSTVSVCLHCKRYKHIINGINVQSHLAISWCTAVGYGKTLFVSKCLCESVFGLEHNDWFYKG